MQSERHIDLALREVQHSREYDQLSCVTRAKATRKSMEIIR